MLYEYLILLYCRVLFCGIEIEQFFNLLNTWGRLKLFSFLLLWIMFLWSFSYIFLCIMFSFLLDKYLEMQIIQYILLHNNFVLRSHCHIIFILHHCVCCEIAMRITQHNLNNLGSLPRNRNFLWKILSSFLSRWNNRHTFFEEHSDHCSWSFVDIQFKLHK